MLPQRPTTEPVTCEIWYHQEQMDSHNNFVLEAGVQRFRACCSRAELHLRDTCTYMACNSHLPGHSQLSTACCTVLLRAFFYALEACVPMRRRRGLRVVAILNIDSTTAQLQVHLPGYILRRLDEWCDGCFIKCNACLRESAKLNRCVEPENQVCWDG